MPGLAFARVTASNFDRLAVVPDRKQLEISGIFRYLTKSAKVAELIEALARLVVKA